MCVDSKIIHNENKGQLRKLALEKRNALSEPFRRQAGEKIARRIMEHPELKKASVVMCYRSFRSEVPTDMIIRALEEAGKKLCFPLCEKDGLMLAMHPENENAWKKGMMGIMEPDRERSELIDPCDIDVVICPMVAFDEEKRRMGYGGAYYDRFLPKSINAYAIGVAFESQRMDSVPVDEYDCPMQAVATEEKWY